MDSQTRSCSCLLLPQICGFSNSFLPPPLICFFLNSFLPPPQICFFFLNSFLPPQICFFFKFLSPSSINLLFFKFLSPSSSSSALQARLRLIGTLPREVQEPLSRLHSSLNGTSMEDFFQQTEVLCGPSYLGLLLKKADKKKERCVWCLFILL